MRQTEIAFISPPVLVVLDDSAVEKKDLGAQMLLDVRIRLQADGLLLVVHRIYDLTGGDTARSVARTGLGSILVQLWGCSLIKKPFHF